MTKRILAVLLALTMLVGVGLMAVYATETDNTEPSSQPAEQTETTAEQTESSAEEDGVVVLENEMFASALRAQEGQTLTYTFSDTDFTAEDGDMLLFSFDAKGENVCSEVQITVDFSNKDMVVTYYVPVQWSRIYMPMLCSGSFEKATVTVKTGAVLVAEATAENKGDTAIEDLTLQSGMWMLEEFESGVLQHTDGVRATNEDAYTAAGVTTSETVDLVVSSCGQYVYSIGGGNLTVTDVSDPANPKIRSIFRNPDYGANYGNTRQIALIPGRGANGGDAVMFTCRIGGVYIVDVSDPDAPVELSHHDSLEMATGITIYENYAFVCNRFYGVEVVDISDLTKPTHVSVIARGGEVQSCRVSNGILYCGIYDLNLVEIYDVHDLLNPKLLGSVTLNGRGDGLTIATIDGRTYLYAGTGHHSKTGLTESDLYNLDYGQGNGLDIFDVTDPTNPELLSVSKIDGRFCHSKCDYWGAEVSVVGDKVYAYLLSTYNGAYIYDVTDPAAPIRLAHVTVRVDRNSSFYNSSAMGHTSGVYPVAFQYDPDEYKQAPIGALTVYEGALYLAGVYTDLHIYQTEFAHALAQEADPAQLTAEGSFYDDSFVATRPGGQTYAVATHGDYLYVASGNQGILIYSKDLKTLYKTIPVTDMCYDVYIQDGLLYCADGRNGAVVYTISEDGMTLTEQKRYISKLGTVTTVRPSPTGKFVAMHVGATNGEIADMSAATPKQVARCSTSTQAYHHNVGQTENGRYVVFWGLSGNEQWYDFGENDSYATPQLLPISPFKSQAASYGGYNAYKDNVIIQTRYHGYIYYDPTNVTAAEVADLAANHLIRPVVAYGGTSITSAHGRATVYKNLMFFCDRMRGRIYICDISDIDKPVLLESYEGVRGNPDLAVGIDDVLYIPMGYEGIMMMDLTPYLNPHEHCLCGGAAQGVGGHSSCADIKWTPISEALEDAGLTAQTADFGKLPSGNYYLDTDVHVTGISDIGAKSSNLATNPSKTITIQLCLNGHNITTECKNVFGRIKVMSSLSITDCSAKQEADGSWNFDGTVCGGTANYGQVIYTHAGSTLNIYGGNFTTENTATSGGVITLASDSCGDQDKDGDEDEDDKVQKSAKSTLNLYNGKIYGGSAENGGNICIQHISEMNMYGGVVTGGSATAGNGGNIRTNSSATLNAYGGEISDGTASNRGGNVYISSGMLIDGVTIKNGEAQDRGGNIYNSAGSITMNSGIITAGECTDADAQGGNIYNTGTFTLNGGNITEGTSATIGGNLVNGKTFTMYGGTISDGDAKKGEGGNLIVGSGSTGYIYGGTISDGTATGGAGNVQVYGALYLCGGTIENGSARVGGNIRVSKGTLYVQSAEEATSPLIVRGGSATSAEGTNVYVGNTTSGTTPTMEVEMGSFSGGTFFVGPNATVKVSGNPVIDNLTIPTGKTVTVEALTEGAQIGIVYEDVQNSFGTGPADAAAYLTSLNAQYAVSCQEGALYLVSPVAVADGKNYGTVTEACSLAESYVKLTGDVTEDVVIDKEVYLDLNGYTLTGDVSGEGLLYGMDSATDSYSTQNMGRITGVVSCQVAGHLKTDVTGAIKRYLAIADATGYTFHRIYLGLTHTSMQPNTAGVGYKAVFAGDEMVRAQLEEADAYGFILWVGEDGEKHSYGKGVNTFKTVGSLSLRLDHFDVENYGETYVYGQVYMNLKDGTQIVSSTYKYTLRQMLERVAANIEKYTPKQVAALKAFVAAYAKETEDWALDSLR